LEAGAGPFALLLAALVAVVVGLGLLLLTAALAIGSAPIPDWLARFLPGVAPGLDLGRPLPPGQQLRQKLIIPTNAFPRIRPVSLAPASALPWELSRRC
jgi:hypothetical protein